MTIETKTKIEQLREAIEKVNEDFQRESERHRRREYITNSSGERRYVGSEASSMVFADICEKYRNMAQPLQNQLDGLEGRPVPQRKIEAAQERLKREEEFRDYSDWVERLAINHGG